MALSNETQAKIDLALSKRDVAHQADADDESAKALMAQAVADEAVKAQASLSAHGDAKSAADEAVAALQTELNA